MDVLLNCAVNTAAVPVLDRRRPAVLAPFLGESVLVHALAGLAAAGTRRVCLLPADRAEEFRPFVGRGNPWGLEIQLAPAGGPPPPEFATARAVLLDRLPQLPDQPLWESYPGWFAAQQALLPTVARQRVGMREVSPGVFVGLRSQVAADAQLLAPCWIGANVFVGPSAIIGPAAIVEDGSYVDAGAEISGSLLGPGTYAGSFTEIRGSFAAGSELLNLASGSVTEVTDRFLLGTVQPPAGGGGGWRRLFQLGRPSRARPVAADRTALTGGWGTTGERLEGNPGGSEPGRMPPAGL